jgi:hypothetical protein
MQTAWVIFKMRSLNPSCWQRHRVFHLRITRILVRCSSLRLLMFYDRNKKMWN